MTLRQDSIKGNLCCNIFSKTSEENLFRVTAPNCQPDLLLSNRITTSPPPSLYFMPPSLCSFLRHFLTPLLFPIRLSIHPVTLSSPPSLFSHSDTLFPRVHRHLPRADRKSDADKGKGSDDPGWITRLCNRNAVLQVMSDQLLFWRCVEQIIS